MSGRWIRVVFAALAILIGLCVGVATADEPIRVVTAIAPFVEFVEAVGGSAVVASSLIPESQSPHVFEPTARQIAALADARIYISAGLPFEKTLVAKIKSGFPNLAVIDGVEGAHLGSGHEHWHVWLSPKQAKVIVGNVAKALTAALPEQAGLWVERRDAYWKTLDALDAHIRSTLADVKRREFVVVHPSLECFAEEYGLTEIAMEHEGKEPGPKGLTALIERARAADARVVFAEPQISRKSADALARELGARVIVINPLAADYAENMKRIAAALSEALR